MKSNKFVFVSCPICGSMIINRGGINGSTSHYMMHVRRGDVPAKKVKK